MSTIMNHSLPPYQGIFALTTTGADAPAVDEYDESEEYTPTCSKGWANRCARAKCPKCRCRCGGHNHGNPKAREGKLHSMNEHLSGGAKFSPLFDPYVREALRQTPCCKWCGHALCGPAVGHPHDGGWVVPGLHSGEKHGGPEGRWWLFVVCEKCNYEWALWKLGVSRNWTPDSNEAKP